jgi:hypothetical protein
MKVTRKHLHAPLPTKLTGRAFPVPYFAGAVGDEVTPVIDFVLETRFHNLNFRPRDSTDQ